MKIKLQVISRVLRIIEERLDKIPENLTEIEAYEQAIDIVKDIWKQ
jgi:hypothetical protein